MLPSDGNRSGGDPPRPAGTGFPMSDANDLTFMQSCDGFGALLRFGRVPFALDAARATRTFERRLTLAGAAARPVACFADPLACCEAAYRMAWTEMVDRAPQYARSAALETLRAAAQSSRDPPPDGELVAAAEKAVDRDFFLDAHIRNFGPPYHTISDADTVERWFRWKRRHRNTDCGVLIDDAIVTRANKVGRRLGAASRAAFRPIGAAIVARLPDAPDSNWISAWEAAWWAAWDAPAAAEARRVGDDSRFAVAEEKAAAAAQAACHESCRHAWASAVNFAYTALVRSPEFAAPEAVAYAVTHLLARRAGIAVDDAALAFAATHIEPCLAGIYLYFITPSAILCAPWPST